MMWKKVMMIRQWEGKRLFILRPSYMISTLGCRGEDQILPNLRINYQVRFGRNGKESEGQGEEDASQNVSHASLCRKPVAYVLRKPYEQPRASYDERRGPHMRVGGRRSTNFPHRSFVWHTPPLLQLYTKTVLISCRLKTHFALPIGSASIFP